MRIEPEIAAEAPVTPVEIDGPEDRDELIEGLMLLGRLLLASGDAVSEINLRLRNIATAWGAPEAQFIVLPNLMMASFDPNRPAHIMSRDLASEHLRLDQVIKVMHLARIAEKGDLPPGEAARRLREVERSKLRRSILPEVIGTVIMTFGMALMFRPDDASVPLYLGLGVLVGLMLALARKLPGLSAVMPVVVAFVASVVAFSVTGDRYDSAPVEALIPALTVLLPGALLTMSAVDLASGEVVSGSSRFLEGMLQLSLLAFGIFAAASLMGVQPSTSQAHGEGFTAWAPWIGVPVFAIGIALRESAPRAMVPWLLLVLSVAHAAQLAGDAMFGPILSGFTATLVVVPLVQYLERFDSAPPAFALFLPAFLMLVPGSLGLLGVSELASVEPTNGGIGGIVSALSAILSIALGVLVGTKVVQIVRPARYARKRLVQTLKLPPGGS
ncbi:MAG: threonine/serine exporter family protein [Actinomycetota bacterium]|nr:threonine/serine exporter family protein [Actinomycetota bacterium]